MSVVPSAQPAIEALLDLRGQIAARAAVRTVDPLGHDDALQLAADLHRVYEISLWCRDASIGLSRTSRPQVTWPELQDQLGVSYRTLYSRYHVWRKAEER